MEEETIKHYAKYMNGEFLRIVRGFGYKMPYGVFICEHGHTFKLSFSNIRRGRWCWYCVLGYKDMDLIKRAGEKRGYKIIVHPERLWTCFQCINCKTTIKLSKRPKKCECGSSKV